MFQLVKLKESWAGTAVPVQLKSSSWELTQRCSGVCALVCGGVLQCVCVCVDLLIRGLYSLMSDPSV